SSAQRATDQSEPQPLDTRRHNSQRHVPARQPANSRTIPLHQLRNPGIPLPTWVVEALKEQQEGAPACPRDMTWVHRDKTTQTVTARLFFHDGHGAPRRYYDIRREWNAAVTAAGVEPKGEEGTGLHRLRHTYAGDLIRQGVDIYVVSRLMGHSSVRVTEKYYAHLRKETLESAREALNSLTPPRPRLALVRTA
ncbi:MAG: tyrosine-type recombinase/integrase, partial [Streptosporangiales bacterium]|nr:tyrosine-type recombinase/integrase [Streptosporangiales bacterium]